jgi:hypothetical protein
MTSGRSSNDNGRTLEYLITERLKMYPGCSLTQRATSHQSRDKVIAKTIHSVLYKTFGEAALISRDWILQEVTAGSQKSFVVDRADDGDSGVADLIVTCGSKELLLSLKHNHDALGHPRPYSLIKSVGFSNSTIELDHRARMDRVTRKFRSAAGTAATFSSIPTHKQKLYIDTCQECATSIGMMATNPKFVESLFTFLVSPGCKKLIVKTDARTKALKGIEVHDYTKIVLPRAVTTSIDVRSRATSLSLEFDNKWVIDLRIHNASSRISTTGQLSLKFDTQKGSMTPLPPIVTLI